MEIINLFSKCLIVVMNFKLFNFLKPKQEPQLVASLHELSVLWYKRYSFCLSHFFFHYHEGNVKNAFEVKKIAYLGTVA